MKIKSSSSRLESEHMKKSRRIFIAQVAACSASAAMLSSKEAAAATNEPHANYHLSGKAAAFVKTMGIKVPIIQAVTSVAGAPELSVAAVCNAGGLGGFGVSWFSEEEIRSRVKQVKALTKSPFAVGYILAISANTLQVALDSGAPVVQFSFGMPTQKQVAAIRSAGGKFGIQISTAAGARQALDLGTDYVNVQGQEAGGHIQAQGSWRDNLPHILDIAGATPVNVAGGLSTGKDLRQILMLGASAGVFGTRFIATKEFPIHPEYKRRLMSAGSNDTVLTVCFDGGWPHALHRALRNPTVDAWEAAGSPPPGARPGEGEILACLATCLWSDTAYWSPKPIRPARSAKWWSTLGWV